MYEATPEMAVPRFDILLCPSYFPDRINRWITSTEIYETITLGCSNM